MTTYCITAARPNDADHHLNTEFKLWRYDPTEERPWQLEGWRAVDVIVDLLAVGHDVLTAKSGKNGIRTGAAVEVVLRIAHNETNYPIGGMPDE